MTESRTVFFIKACILGFSGILFVAGVLIILDSVYFGSFQLTVLNSFLYNLDSSNLAAHGIHPRYLHSLVNMHVLFGPLWSFALGAVFYAIITNLFKFLKNPRSFLHQVSKDDEKYNLREENSETPNLLSSESWNRLRSRLDGPSLRKSNLSDNLSPTNLRVSSEHQLNPKYYYNSKRSWMIYLVLLGTIIFGCGLIKCCKTSGKKKF